ncbi:MAG: S8 family serine peptidase [Halobacteriovoraceae bacterium]|nr:S8 family serine peptidase [Halobacteriovoraceae bacterium]
MKFILLALFLSFKLHATESQKILIKLKPGIDVSKFLEEFDLGKATTYFDNLISIKLESNIDPNLFVERLSKSEKIEFAEIDLKRKRDFGIPTPIKNKKNLSIFNQSFFNDEYAGRLWSFYNSTEFGTDLNLAYLNGLVTPQKDIIVAVVDTGVDYNHDDLKANMWINHNEIPDNNIDDDGNGYVDDIYGIDTLNRDADDKASSDPMDAHYHGTHVAGTIGAVQNNRTGIPGVAPRVKIMAIKTVPSRGDEKDSDVIEALLYAARNGAKVINCSFGKNSVSLGKSLSETIDYIGKNYGTLVVVAAGNNGRDIDKNPIFPASMKNQNIFTIGASQNKGEPAYFSNFGQISVDLFAPGMAIYSTSPRNSYRGLSGTSMAAPFVSGVVALIWSIYPDISLNEIKEVLMKSVDIRIPFRDKANAPGHINVYKALSLLEAH